MKVRIGIDVGGTFTDAVIIDNETFELIGKCKVPTTHHAPEGVAAGIVQVLQKAMKEYHIKPEDVTFIAHATTQATNALLEGDVSCVGVLAQGQGLEGLKVKSDTNIEAIELTSDKKKIHVVHHYLDTASLDKQMIKKGIKDLRDKGAEVFVVASAFSVDDPTKEIEMQRVIQEEGYLVSATHEISKLYGLRTRTRTAVVNASILPKMMTTAEMTESSVQATGIQAPLMIMRCDGGVMSVQEIKARPILTFLSGPAAGVAGALMYERVSNGLFLEVGGTSTDISVIRDGKVMVDYAEVGGHKTYVTSLDVRTVGVGGGSMIRVGQNGIIDVGPRSAHIAGLPYTVYNDINWENAEIVLIQPIPGDPNDYVAIKTPDGTMYALTLTCAANAAGYVLPEYYAYGNVEGARKAFQQLAKHLNQSVDEILQQVHQKAAKKIVSVIKKMIKDYNLEGQTVTLVGGGGGCAAVVPYLSQHMNLPHTIAKNAEVISPIGVALAMVRDVVERTIPNPTNEDILRVREEARSRILQSGASPDTVEIHVEVDSKRNIVRATATGATQLQTKNLSQALTISELQELAAQSMGTAPDKTKLVGSTKLFYIFTSEIHKNKFFGLIKQVRKPLRVVDQTGVIRLQRSHGEVVKATTSTLNHTLRQAINKLTTFGDGGAELPDVFIVNSSRIIDFTGLQNVEQMVTLANTELSSTGSDEPIYILLVQRGMAS
jgi:N-methylhydantoinase A